MAVGRERKTGNIAISPREHQDGQIQPAEDTLCVILRNSCAFGVNPCRSWAFTANKLTNTLKYVERCVCFVSAIIVFVCYYLCIG